MTKKNPTTKLNPPSGFTAGLHPANTRLQTITLDRDTSEAFHSVCKEIPVQTLEYKPFTRFAIADALDELTGFTLGATLRSILLDRTTGAFLLDYENSDNDDISPEDKTNFHIQLSTAVSHLFGIANFDAMYGSYYARFAVENTDNSDTYLRKAYRRMELHNDGTYVDERTDFVLMMKLAEKNTEGGDSLLLHMDDWQELEKFYNHPMANQDIVWGSPPSKKIQYKIRHPVFFEVDAENKPHMLYIDQFAEPQSRAQGRYLYQMGESLEQEPRCFNVPVPVGSTLVIQNHIWLHGRDKFKPHPQLYRELLRQRGCFCQ